MINALPVQLFCLVFTVSAIEHPQLIQVQMIIRHADRAPLFEFTSPESSRLFSRGLGEITNEGLLRVALQGTAFKLRYRSLGLLRDQMHDEEVHILLEEYSVENGHFLCIYSPQICVLYIFVRSSPMKRALMSAAAFSAAFIASDQAPRVHTNDSVEDEKVLISDESLENRCQEPQDLHAVLENYRCSPNSVMKEFVKDFPDCEQFPYTKIEAAIAEMEHSAVELPSALEKCARGDGRKIQFKSLSIKPIDGSELNMTHARDMIGPLMSIVTRNIGMAVTGGAVDGAKKDPLVFIYFTHADILLAAAQALGIIAEYEGKSPEFSSAIAIETWKTRDGFEIKAMVKDGLKNPFLHAAKYRLQEFKSQIAPYTSLDQTNVQWDANATSVYNFTQFDKDVRSEQTSQVIITSERQEISGDITLPF
ncbi:hypothetical protein PRIPAC_95692, partial [Pristionchus pacificus]|uniref:acid phosphatase n=1 Tax=Pristionchus pacificus TaxID=54126 RepID=A0A2A6D3H0_PRIPA